MTTENSTQILPGDDAVQLSSAGKTWRFSKGKIVTGREADGTLRERARIVGRLLRVGIYEGETSDQRPYAQLESDIETSEGVLYLKASLLDEHSLLRPSRSVLDFAFGLLQIEDPTEVFLVTATQGQAWVDDQGREMSPSTYVNFARVDEKNIAHPIYKPKGDRQGLRVPMLDQWRALELQIRAHPLFAERPVNHEDEERRTPTDQLSELVMECAERGWPTPYQAPVEWLSMVARFLKLGRSEAMLAGHTDAQWGLVREGLRSTKAMPAALQPAKERLAEYARAATDARAFGQGDPFADA